MAAASGAAVVGQARERAAPTQRSTPLPKPSFYWGIGIENCWMAQTDPQRDGNRRLLDVFLQMDHYRRWKEDLDLLPATGVNCLRYSVPWYRAEPKPGVYDWSWIDKPIEYLVNKLKIIPIMDLIHYGTPTWMPDGVADERFPEAIGRYADAMARHFKGLVNHYTPHNEPQITCLFCGLLKRWPPYQGTPEAWARIGAAVAKGMVLEMQAIRAAIPDAVIVSVECLTEGVVDRQARIGQDDPRRAEFHMASSYYPAALAYGKIAAGHPLAEFVVGHGVKDADLDWFRRNAAQPDYLGWNSYPAINTDGGIALQQAANRAAAGVEQSLRRAQTYFRLPVYITETSSGLKADERVAYIAALGEMVARLRKARFPLVGVNWWPLFETIQWDYREVVDKPLASFIRRGGWNNGLFEIEPQPDGALKRVPTPAVEAFRQMIEQQR
jgi:beta-glucosidase/6-phospho-beta-glucosidase/beta-galactosidase